MALLHHFTVLYTAEKSYQPIFNDNFNSSCPIPVILVQLLLSENAVENWFYFPPHPFSVRDLSWKILRPENYKFSLKMHAIPMLVS